MIYDRDWLMSIKSQPKLYFRDCVCILARIPVIHWTKQIIDSVWLISNDDHLIYAVLMVMLGYVLKLEVLFSYAAM